MDGEFLCNLCKDISFICPTHSQRRLVADSIAYADLRRGHQVVFGAPTEGFRTEVSAPRPAAGQKPLAGPASLPQLRQAMELGGMRLSTGALGRPPSTRCYVRKRKL